MSGALLHDHVVAADVVAASGFLPPLVTSSNLLVLGVVDLAREQARQPDAQEVHQGEEGHAETDGLKVVH